MRERLKVIAVDIDPYEHMKNTVHVDQVIVADAKRVIEKLLKADGLLLRGYEEWAKICLGWKNKYPVCLKEYYDDSNGINMYVFVEELSKAIKDDSVLVTDAGSAVYVPAQGLKTRSLSEIHHKRRSGRDGLYASRRHRGMYGEERGTDLGNNRRRKPADEYSGASDLGALPSARQALCMEQRRLFVHKGDAEEIL